MTQSLQIFSSVLRDSISLNLPMQQPNDNQNGWRFEYGPKTPKKLQNRKMKLWEIALKFKTKICISNYRS